METFRGLQLLRAALPSLWMSDVSHCLSSAPLCLCPIRSCCSPSYVMARPSRLPPTPTTTVVCCVLVSGLVGFCLVPLFSSGSEKHQAFHPGPGPFQPKPMQSWRSGGLHTQWQAHNSIRSQVLMGRQNLSSSTGIDRPKCTRWQMFMEGALPGPRQGPASPVFTPPPSPGLQECRLSTSASHGQKPLQ